MLSPDPFGLRQGNTESRKNLASLEQMFFLATFQSILLILTKLMKSFHSTSFILAVFDMIMFSLIA